MCSCLGRAGCLWLIGLGLVSIASGAAEPAELPDEVSYCLDCHADEGLTLPLDDGDELPLGVDGASFLASVHGGSLICTDCHVGYDGDEHPSGASFAGRRSYVQAAYDLCKPCHFETYTRTLESVHFAQLQAGNPAVPVCSDCHGAHDVQPPDEPHRRMSASCGACHRDVFEIYAASVHGAALGSDEADLPACADCHTAHSIQQPGEVSFHLSSPTVCLSCHGDEERMRRHGLATTIATTYLADFHGVTASLADPKAVKSEEVVVVCTDCHGVHDIASTRVLGEAEMEQRVEAVCARCHEGASPEFSAAWLSHYPPSWSHAPLVFLVTLFYRVLIPFMVVGLGLQVFLHLYRVGVRR